MFQTFLTQPFYNGFVYLIGIMPGGDVGFAIIVLTLLIRTIFYPAFAASIRTQIGMQTVQGEVDRINEQYKDDANERARLTMELFKANNIRPFSSILALLVQIPVFIALYWAFFREGLPKIATHLLYTFVPTPVVVNTEFLGMVNLLKPHNLLFALLVAGLQYVVAKLSVSRMKNGTAKADPAKEAAQRMQQQMLLYFLPSLMGFVTYSFPAAVGLYFIVGNIYSIGQELLIKRQMQQKAAR